MSSSGTSDTSDFSRARNPSRIGVSLLLTGSMLLAACSGIDTSLSSSGNAGQSAPDTLAAVDSSLVGAEEDGGAPTPEEALARTADLVSYSYEIANESDTWGSSAMTLTVVDGNTTVTTQFDGVVGEPTLLVDSVIYTQEDGVFYALPRVDLLMVTGVPGLASAIESLQLLSLERLPDEDGYHVYLTQCGEKPADVDSTLLEDACQPSLESKLFIDPEAGIVSRLSTTGSYETELGEVIDTTSNMTVTPLINPETIVAPDNADWSRYNCIAQELGLAPDDKDAINSALDANDFATNWDLVLSCESDQATEYKPVGDRIEISDPDDS